MSAQGVHDIHHGTIICHQCGKTGTMVWEDERASRGRYVRQLIRIDGGFHERLSVGRPHLLELVCNGCRAAQSSPIQP